MSSFFDDANLYIDKQYSICYHYSGLKLSFPPLLLVNTEIILVIIMKSTLNEKIDFLSPSLYMHFFTLRASKSRLYRDMHFHNAIEIVRVEQGVLLCHLEDEVVTLQSGDILLLNSAVMHRLLCDNDSTVFTYFQIDIAQYALPVALPATQSIYDFMHINVLVPYKVFSQSEELDAVLRNIQREYEAKEVGYMRYITAEIFKISAIMQRQGLTPSQETVGNAKLMEKLMPAVRYAEEHYTSPVRLEDAGNAVFMDKFYFCKQFKKAFGGSFVEFINFLRMRRARQLLTETQQSIGDISIACGFESVQYFNRLFKLKNGCTPSAYRKMHLNRQDNAKLLSSENGPHK